MSDNPEVFKGGAERTVETGEINKEQLEKTRLEHETTPEFSPRDAEQSAENAKIEAMKVAVSVEAGGAEKKREGTGTPAARRGAISKAQKKASFKREMKEVQRQLSPTSRAFSKVIHNKAIEQASDAVGATVARPNAILAGAVAAFIVTLVVYFVAKNIGYTLSGFETIGAFIVGWVIGIVYDYLRILVTGRPN